MMGAVLNYVDKVVEIIGHFDLVVNLTFIGVQYFYFDPIFDKWTIKCICLGKYQICVTFPSGLANSAFVYQWPASSLEAVAVVLQSIFHTVFLTFWTEVALLPK